MKQVYATILNANADASRNGTAWNTNQLVSASFQTITADTTASGTIKIQFSNDNPNPSGKGSVSGTFTPTNWTDIPNATATMTAGVTPGIVIPNMCFGYVRAVFTRSGGTTVPIQVLAFGLSV